MVFVCETISKVNPIFSSVSIKLENIREISIVKEGQELLIGRTVGMFFIAYELAHPFKISLV
jgi:hypothetical protein